MARKNAETNSDSSSARAVALMLTLIAIVPVLLPSAPSSENLSNVITEPRQNRDIRQQDHPNQRQASPTLFRTFPGARALPQFAPERRGCNKIEHCRHDETDA